ncbi:RHS repeat domain-containing protein [Aequorivita viscosa]|uniref:RHS repeat-associated core domain-containing protein n=1 Tax=Aequorivita viscosa TaxID=797419 RepID=A0A1M6M1U8_9FLAO|nr:RHS repeat-associated core domain-containing protein [Aequorivita viscosa]SDX31441.1 RHS repeat-associated core domain-containing protein [Aequorivita viscosa]SHJ77439.1 RHS repeat-associated core domain-containing protein [Aequorivita viscosa]
MLRDVKDPKLISYTKHYYASTPLSTGIGTERIASVIGSKRGLGAYCFSDNPSVSLEAMEIKVDAAGTAVQEAFAHFEKTITLPRPFLFSSGRYNCSGVHVPEDYTAFWYHPDLPIAIGMGSSSYITNLAGEITQHMEYLPFGETLVEEHLNSNNSPYKFNAKELDAETGNYYYEARYYDPK